MYISKLSLVNYRNFLSTEVLFNKGVNTIIGENGSGKTNLFRALRLMLDDDLFGSSHKLDENDFHRGLDSWKGHWIIVSLEFNDIVPDEAIQALFLHSTGVIDNNAIEKATYNLIFRPNASIRIKLSELENGDISGMREILDSISISDYETIFTGKSEADFTDPLIYKELVGNFEEAVFSNEITNPSIGVILPKIMSIHREVSFTYIQALRDVVSDFHNNKKNPLLTLLKSMGGEMDSKTMEPIVESVSKLNKSIEDLSEVKTVRSDILNTVKATAGETYAPSTLSIKSSLSNEADKLFQSLRLHIGESNDGYEGSISELSLGGANLIYLTLKLLEFKYQKKGDSFANFLLIEEPESHLHTHIQKTLFDKINYDDTQIIYSTHSTHISEVSNIENINIISKLDGVCEVFQPSCGLTPDESCNIQRYLDAIRSNLLFAKSVILVEGDAEEILIPIFVKKLLGLSLDELGISLINIRSTGFKNVALLFHSDRIRKRCSIITDLDASTIDTTDAVGDTEEITKIKHKHKHSQESGAARKVILDNFTENNEYLETFFSPHTFEIDLCSENKELFIGVVDFVYSDQSTVDIAKKELESTDLSVFSHRALTMAKHLGKGWFAILLGGKIESNISVPKNIIDAIFYTHPVISDRIWIEIFKYRLSQAEVTGQYTAEQIEEFKVCLNEFESAVANLPTTFNEFSRIFTGDALTPVISRYTNVTLE